MTRRLLLWLLLSVSIVSVSNAQFRVQPLLQDPRPTAMTVVWLSETDTPGTLVLFGDEGEIQRLVSDPELAAGLDYQPWESQEFFEGSPPPVPYLHRVHLTGLQPDRTYPYQVHQGEASAHGRLRTAPNPGSGPVRLIFFADSETEPESTGNHVDWTPVGGVSGARSYPLDQTQGLANNLSIIQQRDPDLLAIAGDLVESGGEQRDWDEFWAHFNDVDGVNLVGNVPLLAAPGNHEYYEGPAMGRYDQPGSERASRRFRTYFGSYGNGGKPIDEGRYYAVRYGPVTLIAIDVTNGLPNQSGQDTNFFLLGQGEADGGGSPGFGPGSGQHAWLAAQLAEAQQQSAFTFVFFHHVPYSVGPHGWPAGDPNTETGVDSQSGVPVRSLTPLFMRYGVDALIAGHDEMWERSELDGIEMLPDGSQRPHRLQVFDVGVAGDGLRAPEPGLVNPHQRFLVHDDAPEVWVGGILQSGGKHYGHLEVDVLQADDGDWQAVMKPVHVFPLLDNQGVVQAVERRLYDDVVTLTAASLADTVEAAAPAR